MVKITILENRIRIEYSGSRKDEIKSILRSLDYGKWRDGKWYKDTKQVESEIKRDCETIQIAGFEVSI